MLLCTLAYTLHLLPIQNSFVNSIINSSFVLTRTRIVALEFNLYLC